MCGTEFHNHIKQQAELYQTERQQILYGTVPTIPLKLNNTVHNIPIKVQSLGERQFHSDKLWMFHVRALKYICIMQQTHTDKIYLILSCITIHRHVSVASATIVRVSYKNTNNIEQINVNNTYLIWPHVTVIILSSPYGHGMSNYIKVKFSAFVCILVWHTDGSRKSDRNM
jgi:hypothetical protein